MRGAVSNGKRVDADAVTRLATLPSRDVLLGQLAGGIVSPLTTHGVVFWRRRCATWAMPCSR